MNNFIKLMILALKIIFVQAFFALLILSAASAASAQESLMITLDYDQDGLISLQEAAGHRTLLANFNKVDSNEDGYISLDELAASKITRG